MVGGGGGRDGSVGGICGEYNGCGVCIGGGYSDGGGCMVMVVDVW